MPKIYEALKAAEKEQAGESSETGFSLPSGGEPPQSLREKLVGVYQSIDSTLHDLSSWVVTFVSARSGEGASTLLREFARLMGTEMGKRVALLDADRGFGRHREAFGVELEATCEDVLAGRCQLEEALRPVADGALHLGMVTSPGSALSNVVSSARFRDLAGRLRDSFDLVLFDTPPVSESSDALLLVRESDGIVLVVEAEKTRWQVAEGIRDRITKQGGDILGVILNKRRHYIPYAIYKRL